MPDSLSVRGRRHRARCVRGRQAGLVGGSPLFTCRLRATYALAAGSAWDAILTIARLAMDIDQSVYPS